MREGRLTKMNRQEKGETIEAALHEQDEAQHIQCKQKTQIETKRMETNEWNTLLH